MIYRAVNRVLNFYEGRTGRTFGPGHPLYGIYWWFLVKGR